jgi:hypothetical protein
MKCRRLFALLTSVTMLHLTVAAGDAVCATHGVDEHHGASSPAAPVAEHAMKMGGRVMSATTGAPASTVSDAPAANADTPPCEVPTQLRCCVALVGCSLDSIATGTYGGFVASVSASARILVARHDAPASFASAPEPPPPKA